MRKIALTVAACAIAVAGCSSNADVASENLSKAADNFEIARRIVFIDTMTNQYMLEIIGRCNIAADGDGGGQLEVTCRTDQGDKKHFLGLNHTATYVVEQLDPAKVSQSQYKVFFKPSTIIPDVDMK